MIGGSGNVWTFLAAVVIAVPAIIGAITAQRNRNELRTSNGGTIGDRVDKLTDDVSILKDTAIQNRTAILWLQRELTGGRDDETPAGA